MIVNQLKNSGVDTPNLFLLSNVAGSNFYDIVDIRDFLVGANKSGLTVKLPNGKLARAPYCLPYVSLFTRANLSEELNASHLIWKANLDYYNSLDANIVLGQLYGPFVALMNFMGFDNKTPTTEVCQWHINLCKQI